MTWLEDTGAPLGAERHPDADFAASAPARTGATRTVAGGASEDDATRLALAEFREGNLLARGRAPYEVLVVESVRRPAEN